MNKYKDLTIFFVSYYSKSNIEKIINKINKKINILIIDNAKEKNLKKYFEKKFKNVKVMVSQFNSGQTGGINTGFKNIKTNYSLYMDSDVKFNSRTIDKFLETANKIKDFIILAPQHERKFYQKDFFSTKYNQFKEFNLMKLVHGQFLFFNMKNVKKVGYYDEKIFLYYDETDFCLRAYKKNQKIYVLPKIKVRHEGGKSVNLKNKLEIESNKHWHYMWSKFYYFKKNYSTIYAYKNTFLDFFISLFKFFIFYFFDKRKKTIYFNRISGLIHSYIGSKSFKRIKI
jgi:GT2 family glycosyltransferase